MRSIIVFLVCLILPLIISSNASAQKRNLVINGEFILGNDSFDSDYKFNEKDVSGSQTYSVATNPSKVHPLFASFEDHTNGRGKMMVVNGSTGEKSTFWRQTVDVETNHTYVFEFYAASVYPDSPALLALYVNGEEVGTLQLTDKTKTWEKASATWQSRDKTEAKLEIRLKTTAYVGNDFAIDDITFSPE